MKPRTPHATQAATRPGANTGRAFGHRQRIPSGRASGTVWRWRNDPSFASEVSVRQAQRRQSIHDELDAGVIESVRMLRGLVADTDAPPGARVRAATALMDRAGLTPAYAVEVRHKAEYAQQQVAQPHIEDAERMAREILQSLPTVMAILPRDEVEAVFGALPRMT